MIKRNLLYNSLLSVSQIIFPLIIFPYSFKVLQPEGTGLVSFTESLTQYLISFSALGIPIYGVREAAKIKNEREKLSLLFSELFLLQTILTLFIGLVYILLIFSLDKLSSHKSLYFFSCAALIVNVFSVEWFFQGIGEFKYITIRTLVIRSLFILLIIAFVKNRGDYTIYYGITFFTTALSSLFNFTRARKHLEVTFLNLDFKRHIRSLLYIFSASLAINIYVVFDTVILGFLSKSDEVVGYYATALRICKIPLTFITALSAVIIPQISSSYKVGDISYIRNLLNKSFTYVVVLALPVGFGLFLLAPDLVLLLANRNFLPSVPVIRLMAALTLLIGLSNIFGMQILTSFGKERFNLVSVCIGMILSVGCNILLIPLFSYIGTAITTFITELIVTFLTGYYAYKVFHFRFPFKTIVQSVLACILFIPLYLLLERITGQLFVRVGLMIGISAFLYFFMLIYIFKTHYLKEIVDAILIKVRYVKT